MQKFYHCPQNLMILVTSTLIIMLFSEMLECWTYFSKKKISLEWKYSIFKNHILFVETKNFKNNQLFGNHMGKAAKVLHGIVR
jgi:hypothetical protein